VAWERPGHRVAPPEALNIVDQLLDVLAAAHDKGIVHRDLKPANVFLTREGERMQPKLLDFGIAKLTTPLPSGSLTDTGVSVGSPDYMSPEQARGLRDVDYRADIWAFSVVLYEAVTGVTPFNGDNYNALMRAIVEDEPAPLPIDENLDQGLAELILWGLAKDRSERPSSIQELGRELSRWLLDRGVSEDVCGAPLGPKWITRVAQKSVPVIQLDAPEPVRPAVVARDSTLISARQESTVVREPGKSRVRLQVAETPSSRRPPAWLIAALVLVIGGGLAWALARKPSFEGRVVAGPAVGSARAAVQNAPSAEPALEPNHAPVGVASAPPQPFDASAKPSPSSSSVPAIHSAPARVPQQKSRDVKPSAETEKPPSAAKPGRDVHDETRELLQAY
ncbi:MAG TPA: serine/threonine-protein kinase, partial [Polyangiaceae bacterium]|nr:serine/threonine-protein kinase [Polyangiaceae bacterium]